MKNNKFNFATYTGGSKLINLLPCYAVEVNKETRTLDRLVTRNGFIFEESHNSNMAMAKEFLLAYYTLQHGMDVLEMDMHFNEEGKLALLLSSKFGSPSHNVMEMTIPDINDGFILKPSQLAAIIEHIVNQVQTHYPANMERCMVAARYIESLLNRHGYIQTSKGNHLTGFNTVDSFIQAYESALETVEAMEGLETPLAKSGVLYITIGSEWVSKTNVGDTGKIEGSRDMLVKRTNKDTPLRIVINKQYGRWTNVQIYWGAPTVGGDGYQSNNSYSCSFNNYEQACKYVSLYDSVDSVRIVGHLANDITLNVNNGGF